MGHIVQARTLPFHKNSGIHRSSGKQFLKSYIGVCMEGAVVVLACIIYSAFLSSSTPAADATLGAATMVWQYVGQLIFNMLILTGLVRGSDRIVKEMLGL